MKYESLIEGMKRFGAKERDICVNNLGVAPEQVEEDVLIAPWWEPSSMPDLGEAQLLTPPVQTPQKVFKLRMETGDATYVKGGIGAPSLVDSLLALGLTKCKRILFLGSVGAMDRKMEIGDVIVVRSSICGDGVSRYLASDELQSGDVFGQKAYPDPALFERVRRHTQAICARHGIAWHEGNVFSVDTIFGEYAHVDEIMGMGADVIEMETAAAFRAARLMGIPMAALGVVSDNTLTGASIVGERTQAMHERRRFVRRAVLPEIIKSVFSQA